MKYNQYINVIVNLINYGLHQLVFGLKNNKSQIKQYNVIGSLSVWQAFLKQTPVFFYCQYKHVLTLNLYYWYCANLHL